jgi:hypothetical protein
MADHLRAELVVHGLEMVLYRRRPDRRLLHHSDSPRLTERVQPVVATLD